MTLYLLTTIALLCGGEAYPASHRKCQKFYVKCVTQSMRADASIKPAAALAKCVLER